MLSSRIIGKLKERFWLIYLIFGIAVLLFDAWFIKVWFGNKASDLLLAGSSHCWYLDITDVSFDKAGGITGFIYEVNPLPLILILLAFSAALAAVVRLTIYFIICSPFESTGSSEWVHISIPLEPFG